MALNIITINSNQGLPNEQIHNVSSDTKGQLWLSGPSGLSCYNGKSIQVYDTRNGLICPGLRNVYCTAENITWVGTDRGIEALNNKNEFIQLHFAFNWIYGIADCFYFINSILWVGTSYGLLKLNYSNNTLSLVKSFKIGLVTEIIKAEDNSILVLNTAGYLYKCDSEINKFETDIKIEDKITTIGKTIENDYLIGTINGIYLIDIKGKIIFHYKPTHKFTKVTSVSSNNNDIYIGFNQYFVILNSTGFEVKFENQIIFESIINDIFVDKFSNIWIATNNSGLKKITFLRKAITEIERGIKGAAFCICDNIATNNYLVGGAGGISVFNKIKTNDLTLVNSYSLETIVWDIKVDNQNQNNYWIATQDGLFKMENFKNPEKAVEFSNAVNIPARILLNRNDELWLGTISGLFCIKENTCKEILTDQGHSFGYVYTMSLNEKNEIWIGTLGQGLWLEKDLKFKAIHDNILKKDGNTYSVVTNKFGETLVIQQENIIIIDKTLNSKLILQEYPIGGWTSLWLDEHTICTGSSDGICIIDVNNNKLINRVNLLLGKSAWQFTSSRALNSIGDYELYCCLNSGLYYVNLNEIIGIKNKPEVLVEYIKWSNIKPEINDDIYELKSGKWSFELSTYSPWFVDEKQVQYRYKLVGFDENYSVATTEGKIKYNSLPIGTYHMNVQIFTSLFEYTDPQFLFTINVNFSFNSVINSLLSKLTSGFSSLLSIRKNKNLLQENEAYKTEISQRKIAENELIKYKNRLEEIVKQRTKELIIEKDKAESADKLKTIFLANMSHEIRTPLSGIIGINDMLIDSQLAPTQKDYVFKIGKTADHLLQLINNILDITKIESGNIEIEKINFSLSNFLNEIGLFAQMKIIDKDIDFIIIDESNLNYQLVTDQLKLKQILINLISNSIKFTDKGEIILKIKKISTSNNKTVLNFTLSDSGIGMNEFQLSNLFKAYNQTDISIARKYGGTGLGLSISDKFVEMLGGKLTAKSQLGKGSEFSFTLNLEYSNLVDEEKINDEKINNTNKQRILVIDDNQSFIKNITNDLLKFNFVVNSFHTFLEFENDKTETYDVILIDALLPELNSGSDQAIKNIKALKNKCSSLYLLGTSDKHLQIKENLNLNNFEIILKPITTQIIKTKIVNPLLTEVFSKPTLIVDAPTSSEMQAFKIAVAEDNEILQMVVKKLLEKNGYQESIFSNGKLLIDALENGEKFDLILMDIGMPVMDGIEATNYIRNVLKNNDLIIIALTADVTLDTKNKIIDYGMNDYLSKPVNIQSLNQMLEKWRIK